MPFSVNSKSGLTNLKCRLNDCIPDFGALNAKRDRGVLDMRNHVVVDKVSRNIHNGIDWTSGGNKAFNFVTTKKYSGIDSTAL